MSLMEGIFRRAVVIVDGYSHCGILKYQPVEVVLDTTAQAGVDRAVLCQHLGEYENSYLSQVVESRPRQCFWSIRLSPMRLKTEAMEQHGSFSRRPAARRLVRTLFSAVARGRSAGVAPDTLRSRWNCRSRFFHSSIAARVSPSKSGGQPSGQSTTCGWQAGPWT